MAQTQVMPEWKTTVDEIWAILRENAQGMKELRESQKETDRQIQKTDGQLGKLVPCNI